jgi:hypothetical protein
MKSRLRKNHTLVKTAAFYQLLDHIILKSGDAISFEVKVMANRPWYQIIHDYQFSNSSYYDGPDLDRAFDIYTELLLAFKGAAKAEEFRKSRPIYENKIQKMLVEKKNISSEEMYNNLKRKPLFLGLNDF